ncbi:SRPBCC domain-containing protein [Thermostichus vulcanus]|uniref:SRPBCC domain-containing protein n=1 Tax=Thermostichus vulcanus str. 'Rupite' TaxID=2813851 RepID=A0ABT0CBX8_THEVL|nr:SRPBCC domain-containing protein [Thermostichus vulcanus]MCJ2543251.1 SRPBCC domain-containing protein [Thermostichus vulcanus str. 'Rupite']
MKEISTSIDIHASAGKVWQILMDFPAYEQWNPFIRSIEGQAMEGSQLQVHIQPPGGQGMAFKPKVLTALPEREFRWLGHFILPGLFDGEHCFQLEALGEHQVRLTHSERFSGLLLPLLSRSLDTHVRQGFEAMNQALKSRAEAG